MIFDFFKKSRAAAAEPAHDFIVVGQGLAGTLLALELEKHGYAWVKENFIAGS